MHHGTSRNHLFFFCIQQRHWVQNYMESWESRTSLLDKEFLVRTRDGLLTQTRNSVHFERKMVIRIIMLSHRRYFLSTHLTFLRTHFYLRHKLVGQLHTARTYPRNINNLQIATTVQLAHLNDKVNMSIKCSCFTTMIGRLNNDFGIQSTSKIESKSLYLSSARSSHLSLTKNDKSFFANFQAGHSVVLILRFNR